MGKTKLSSGSVVCPKNGLLRFGDCTTHRKKELASSCLVRHLEGKSLKIIRATGSESSPNVTGNPLGIFCCFCCFAVFVVILYKMVALVVFVFFYWYIV